MATSDCKYVRVSDMGRRAPSTVSTVSTQAICRSRQPLDEIAYCNSINALDRGNRWQEAIQQLQDMDSYSFLDWKVFFPWFLWTLCKIQSDDLDPNFKHFQQRLVHFHAWSWGRRHYLKPRFETQCFCL